MANSSYHIFLFPFKWQFEDDEERSFLFSELVNLEKADGLVLGDQRWKTNLYKHFPKNSDYNEFVYFYPFVRDVLYDYRDKPDNNMLIRHYEFKTLEGEELIYRINIRKNETYKMYELDVKHIMLNLYKTGVGLLSFHLSYEYGNNENWNDLLSINEYGRRIYPQFLGDGFSIATPKEKFLANSIELSYKSGSIRNHLPIYDDFEVNTGITSDFINIRPCDLDVIPNHIEQLLPQTFYKAVKKHLQPLMDDRMFVVSTYVDNKNVYSLDIKNIKTEKPKIKSPLNEKLYEYIFVDGPGSGGIANDDLRDELLEKHSYLRWINYGSYYGISRYSLVCYTTAEFIAIHMSTMYYKMAELCLVQRASVLNFTEEVSRISKLDNTKMLAKKLTNLYENYIQFVNKVYFREVTAQEQGIEMYNMMQEKMNIQHEVKGLDEEIEELHNYVSLQEEKERNRQLSILTTLGGLFIMPTFLLTFLSIIDKLGGALSRSALLIVLALLSIGPLFIFNKSKINGKGKELRIWLLILIITIIAVVILFFPVKK